MPSPSVGAATVYTLQWVKGPPYKRSARFIQPNRDGNNHVVGKTYAESSTIKTSNFILNQGLEIVEIQNYADLTGDSQTITMIDNTGAAITVPNVWIESVRITKSNSCVGPGSTAWVIEAEFTVYIPSDW